MKFPAFIILEGPDASGKSTLASALAHRTKGVVLHAASMGDNDARPDNDGIMRRYHSNLIEIVTRNLALGNAVICDRLWLSHVIYARARGAAKTEELASYEADFLAACRALDAFYVFALDDTCIENQMRHQDPDHPLDPEMMGRLLALYKSYYGQWASTKSVPCAMYEFTRHGRYMNDWMDGVQKYQSAFLA